jgi:hypothetical protein
MNKHLVKVLIASLLLALFATACSSGPPTVTQAPPGQDDGGGSEATAEPVEDVGTEETDSATDATEVPSVPVDDRGIPIDIPIMADAYDIQISITRSGVDIKFRVDLGVEDTVAYFQESLPGAGWVETTSQDTAFGALGSMARVNEAEDSMSLSMNFNAGGEFTQVIVSVSRTQVD